MIENIITVLEKYLNLNFTKDKKSISKNDRLHCFECGSNALMVNSDTIYCHACELLINYFYIYKKLLELFGKKRAIEILVEHNIFQDKLINKNSVDVDRVIINFAKKYLEKDGMIYNRHHIYYPVDKDNNLLHIRIITKNNLKKIAFQFHYSKGLLKKIGNKFTNLIYNYHTALNSTEKYLFIVEGEKDVETMKRIGFYSTISIDTVEDQIFLKLCKDKKVYYIPDFDEIGTKKFLKLQSRFKDIQINPIYIYYLLAKLPQKGTDISDLVNLYDISFNEIKKRINVQIELYNVSNAIHLTLLKNGIYIVLKDYIYTLNILSRSLTLNSEDLSLNDLNCSYFIRIVISLIQEFNVTYKGTIKNSEDLLKVIPKFSVINNEENLFNLVNCKKRYKGLVTELINHIGRTSTNQVRSLIRANFIQMAARWANYYNSISKVDSQLYQNNHIMIFLSSRTGSGKSTAIRELLSPFSQSTDIHINWTDQLRVDMAITSNFGAEISEIDQYLSSRHYANFKRLITLNAVSYRKPYEKSYKREVVCCNMIGSSNSTTLVKSNDDRRTIIIDFSSLDNEYVLDSKYFIDKYGKDYIYVFWAELINFVLEEGETKINNIIFSDDIKRKIIDQNSKYIGRSYLDIIISFLNDNLSENTFKYNQVPFEETFLFILTANLKNNHIFKNDRYNKLNFEKDFKNSFTQHRSVYILNKLSEKIIDDEMIEKVSKKTHPHTLRGYELLLKMDKFGHFKINMNPKCYTNNLTKVTLNVD